MDRRKKSEQEKQEEAAEIKAVFDFATGIQKPDGFKPRVHGYWKIGRFYIEMEAGKNPGSLLIGDEYYAFRVIEKKGHTELLLRDDLSGEFNNEILANIHAKEATKIMNKLIEEEKNAPDNKSEKVQLIRDGGNVQSAEREDGPEHPQECEGKDKSSNEHESDSNRGH
jgi:hypothetical protein